MHRVESRSVPLNDKIRQVLRQVLAEKHAFDPYATFKHLDRMGRGFLTATDLLEVSH